MQLTFEAQGDETVIFRADDDSAEPVAHIPWNGEPIEDHWRLVRTFAAAPAMLAALQDAVSDLQAFRRKFHPSDWPEKPIVHTTVLNNARAAIDAATLPDTPTPAPTDEIECGQCEGTGTIEGGLGGDGDDESCPVCDGTGEIEREGSQ